MKSGIKLVLAATAGYFVGYYEFKYKFLKAIANEYLNDINNTDEEES